MENGRYQTGKTELESMDARGPNNQKNRTLNWGLRRLTSLNSATRAENKMIQSVPNGSSVRQILLQTQPERGEADKHESRLQKGESSKEDKRGLTSHHHHAH